MNNKVDNFLLVYSRPKPNIENAYSVSHLVSEQKTKFSDKLNCFLQFSIMKISISKNQYNSLTIIIKRIIEISGKRM